MAAIARAQQHERAYRECMPLALAHLHRRFPGLPGDDRLEIFLAEADVHRGSLRTLRLPEHPPALRKALRGKRAERLVPEELAALLPVAFRRSP